MQRRNIEILPTCDDDDDDDDDESTSSSDDSTYSISVSRDSYIMAASKKSCIEEIEIDLNCDEVDEPLSDEEWLLDAC